MPTIVQTIQGTVTGLWGSALIRGVDGKMHALKVGDVVQRGDLLLTTQNGIVEIGDESKTETAAAVPKSTDDIDRVIAGLNNNDPSAATAAALAADGGSGFEPGLRVDRIVEAINGTSAPLNGSEAGLPSNVATALAANLQNTAQTLNTAPTATAAALSGLEDSTLPISLRGQDVDGTIAGVTVVSIPSGSALLLPDGTPVVAGQTLSGTQAVNLLFRPAPDFNGGAGIVFTVTDDSGAVSAPATTSINVIPVNDAPVASVTLGAGGREDGTLAVGLSGSDVDGSIASVTVTSLPA
ncbi:MAG TPA: Ig-like domain-containing protein, partial [Albitalea sp.]|nr:Ig-like domain-containing protein [Albitalea sp.]